MPDLSASLWCLVEPMTASMGERRLHVRDELAVRATAAAPMSVNYGRCDALEYLRRKARVGAAKLLDFAGCHRHRDAQALRDGSAVVRRRKQSPAVVDQRAEASGEQDRAYGPRSFGR